MTQPFLSAICPVYGGVAWLENALDCFLKQDYQGPHELLVVNSFAQQVLIGNFPNVRIVNLKFRPTSLGELRNLAIQLARGDVIVVWDSDDVFFPGHLSTVARNIEDNDWIWLTPQFWIMGEAIQAVVKGSCPLFSFRKSAWLTVGGYPALTVGEDAWIISKITERFKGKKVEVQPEEITFGYRWGQGSHHVSGEGEDATGKLSAHDRAANALQDRIRNGHEKVGQIVLKPSNPLDWSFKAKQFLDTQKKIPDVKQIAFVELGRLGDIINLLPILKHCAEHYAKPSLVISREFASLLEGVSYVEPFVVDLKHNQLNEAIAIARREFLHVINCQIWGQNFEMAKVCASYNRESWRMAGFAHKFNNETWRPVFDRRNPGREAALWSKLSDGRPMLLVNVTKSVSSPFPSGPRILAMIREWFGEQYNVVDFSELFLPQFFDLVGVMERAGALVTIDTSHLHLAAVTDIPVVALLNPHPWQGTEPRCHCISRMTYLEAEQQPLAIRAAVVQAMKRERYAISGPDSIAAPPARTIYHVCEQHGEKNPKERQRKAIAQASWQALYAEKGVVACHLKERDYPRNALSIGDQRPLPYLKDVLWVGMAKAGPDDIIMFTNDDNFLHPEIADMIRFHCSLWEAVCAQRCEFKDAAIPTLPCAPEKIASTGQMHIGRDLFAFTKRWLVEHWKEIPDAILGASDWDWIMCGIIRKQFGIETSRANIAQNIWPADMERGYVAHEYHEPTWNKPSVVSSSPANLHNRRLYNDWKLPGSKAVIPITVRRSGAFGDALAATCVASRLQEKGIPVIFQTSKEVQKLLRHCPGIALAEATGPCDINLDDSYEAHPKRNSLDFSEIFCEVANLKLDKDQRILPLNCTPSLKFPIKLNPPDFSLPRPWIAIGARSNSFNVRTVPDDTWREVAGHLDGTCFWIANHAPAPDGIFNPACKDIEDVMWTISRCDLFVGVDSGPLHIAAALGITCVAIEQSSSPELHLSDQRDFSVVRPPLDCLNCQAHQCPISVMHPPCQDIQAFDIVRAINDRLISYWSKNENVSAIIPIYRPDAETLNRCLECVLPQVEEVIVTAEGGSNVPATAMLHPKISYVTKFASGIGYGRNVNFGARHSTGKYLLLLNDDVFLEPGAVDALRLEMTPDVGAVTHTLRYPNGTVHYAGKLRHLGARGWHHLDHLKQALTWKEPCDTECACGASMLVRRAAFYQVKGFDEEFFLYSEDDDLALRLRQSGWRLRYTPKASGIHLEHASTDKIGNIKDHVRVSDQLFAKKWKRYLDWNANRVPGDFLYEP